MNTKVLLAGACLFAAAPLTLSAQIHHGGFSSMAGVVAVGSTTQQDDIIRLTPDKPWTAGALWSEKKQQVAAGFVTAFSFRITKPGGAAGTPNRDGGADGLAFVIQNSSPSALGHIGHEIGYGGIPNSLAIELDTWNNAPMGNGDPDNNHLSVQSAGTEPNSYDHRFSLGVASNIPRLDDGRVHTLRIEYLPGRMSISIDGIHALEVEVDLATKLALENGAAWVGFTSATARAWENHDILDWTFTPVTATPQKAAPTLGEGAHSPGTGGSSDLPVEAVSAAAGTRVLK